MKFRSKLPSGYRSRFEERIAASLTKAKIKFKYENNSFVYSVKVGGCFCNTCFNSDAIVQSKLYTPDFFFSDTLILETKGKFTSKDRKKMLAMKQQHPILDIRMLFMADNKLSKLSKTRYSDWCKANGITYAVGTLPKQWLKEFKNGQASSTTRIK